MWKIRVEITVNIMIRISIGSDTGYIYILQTKPINGLEHENAILGIVIHLTSLSMPE
jgi:hypothetical protein